MQLEYSYKNHYKWGFNDNWFNPPEADGYFQLSIGACSRPHLSFRQECINTAKLLGNQFTKPILVALSGGHDSQVVCLSMINAGVPFRPVILRMISHQGNLYNGHDIAGAFAFCKKFNLDPIVEELNIDHYYTTTGMQLISDHCIHPTVMVVPLHLVIKYKDTHAFVIGAGDPVPIRSVNQDTGESSLTCSLIPVPIQQYMIDHGIQAVDRFFMYAPEQIAAYLDHPIIHHYNNARDALDGRDTRDYFTNCVKPMMYSDEWPEIIQRKKNTGYETVPYFQELTMCVDRVTSHINPHSKAIVLKYEELLDHLNSNTGEIKTWKSIDDRYIYQCVDNSQS
jgi:hypothetical protein